MTSLPSLTVRDDLPELGTDLVAALTGLQVDNFSHVVRMEECDVVDKKNKRSGKNPIGGKREEAVNEEYCSQSQSLPLPPLTPRTHSAVSQLTSESGSAVCVCCLFGDRRLTPAASTGTDPQSEVTASASPAQ
jgi:hypothetical protein